MRVGEIGGTFVSKAVVNEVFVAVGVIMYAILAHTSETVLDFRFIVTR